MKLYRYRTFVTDNDPFNDFQPRILDTTYHLTKRGMQKRAAKSRYNLRGLGYQVIEK